MLGGQLQRDTMTRRRQATPVGAARLRTCADWAKARIHPGRTL